MTAEQNADATRAFRRHVDFGKTASDYRLYRVGFPPAFFETLAARSYILAGQTALDLGTGTVQLRVASLSEVFQSQESIRQSPC